MVKKMEDQDKEIKELIKCLKENQNHSKDQYQAFVDQNNVKFSQLKVAVSSTTDRMEMELDQIVKGVKTVTSEEIKNSETSLLSKICFMMEQLQVQLHNQECKIKPLLYHPSLPAW